MDYFVKWLETERKDLLMFYPIDVSDIDKEKLLEEQNKMFEEEKGLFYGIN